MRKPGRAQAEAVDSRIRPLPDQVGQSGRGADKDERVAAVGVAELVVQARFAIGRFALRIAEEHDDVGQDMNVAAPSERRHFGEDPVGVAAAARAALDVWRAWVARKGSASGDLAAAGSDEFNA